MNEQPLDLKGSLAIVRRRRRLVGGLALLGLCGGVAYGAIHPPMPSATALVLLPPTTTTSSGTPTRDITTEIAIASSSPVLSEAGKTVTPHVDETTLSHRVKVSGIGEDVLSIKVRASRGTDAERLANAISTDYITYLNSANSTVSSSALSALQTQAATLSRQVQSLQSQINSASAKLGSDGPTTAAGQRDATLLASLNSEQSSTSLALNSIDSEIAQDEINSSATAGATRVLQQATTVASVSKLRLPIKGGIGLAGGLFVGVIIALSAGRRDRRLRLRDEIAGAIGIPVLASFDAGRHKTTGDWHQILGKYQPPVVDAWNLRRLLQYLQAEEPGMRPNVHVLSFAADQPALAAGPQLATFAASVGIPTALINDTHPAAVPLRAACATFRPDGDRQNLVTVEPGESNMFAPGVELTVTVSALERDRPEISESRPGSTLVAVSSGFAAVDDLARVALAAIDAGRTIDGIIVVNPDSHDSTTGAAPDAEVDRHEPLWPIALDRLPHPEIGGSTTTPEWIR